MRLVLVLLLLLRLLHPRARWREYSLTLARNWIRWIRLSAIRGINGASAIIVTIAEIVVVVVDVIHRYRISILIIFHRFLAADYKMGYRRNLMGLTRRCRR